MVIGHRAQDRDLNDERALERCKQAVRTAITYVLGRIEATGTSPGGERIHRLTMARLRGMPVEMLDRAYNRYRRRGERGVADQRGHGCGGGSAVPGRAVAVRLRPGGT